MPVQNETCLVIADVDGSHPREISDITNTSSVLFAKDAFFACFGMAMEIRSVTAMSL